MTRNAGIALLALCAALLAGVVIGGCGDGKAAGGEQLKVSSDRPLTLRVAHAWPQNSALFQATMVWWADEVARRSGGRVKFEWYPLQQLLKATETVEGVGQGVADIGIIAPAFLTGKLPLTSIEGLPFAWATLRAYADAMREMRALLNREEFAPFNTIVVANTPLPYYHIGTRSSPIQRLDDFKGVRLRSGGGVRAQNLEAVGAAPVFMPDAETYLALQRGTVDGYEGVWVNVVAQSIGEVTRAVTLTDHIISGGAIIVNTDLWKRLPRDLQTLMLQVGREMDDRAVAILPQLDREMMDQAIAKWGIKTYRLPDADLALWKAKSAAVWDRWLAERTQEGKAEAAQQLMAILKKYNKD